MFLKVLVIYSFLLYGYPSSAVLKSEEVLDIVKNCAKSTNVTQAEYERPELFLLSTPTEEQLCMVKCVLERVEMLDFDGNLQKSVISNYISAFNSEVQEEIILCAEKIGRISVCGDLEDYRKCLEPHLFNE